MRVFESDLHKFIPKEQMQKMRRYQGNSIYLPDGKGLRGLKKGNALYIPSEKYGEGFIEFLSGAANFIKNNQDSIKSVADTASSIANTVTSSVKAAKEVEELKALRKNNEGNKSGNGINIPHIPLSSKNIKKKNPLVDKIIQGQGFKILNPE